MNPLWLILIVPLSMLAGAWCTALCAVSKKKYQFPYKEVEDQ